MDIYSVSIQLQTIIQTLSSIKINLDDDMTNEVEIVHESLISISERARTLLHQLNQLRRPTSHVVLTPEVVVLTHRA